MKKVFKNEAEVISLIDKYHQDIRETQVRISEREHLCERLRDTCEAVRISGLRSDIETMHVEIAWREGRLETLKEILAEMRTMELPFNAGAEVDP
jgi:hypothetical protein